MNVQVTEEFRVRVDPELLREAKRVAEEIGTTPGEMVQILFAQLVKRRAMPFDLVADAPSDGLVDRQRRNHVLRELDDSEGW